MAGGLGFEPRYPDPESQTNRLLLTAMASDRARRSPCRSSISGCSGCDGWRLRQTWHRAQNRDRTVTKTVTRIHPTPCAGGYGEESPLNPRVDHGRSTSGTKRRARVEPEVARTRSQNPMSRPPSRLRFAEAFGLYSTEAQKEIV